MKKLLSALAIALLIVCAGCKTKTCSETKTNCKTKTCCETKTNCETETCCGAKEAGSIWQDELAPIDDRVEDLLGRMTVDEKISLLIVSGQPIDRFGIQKLYIGNECLHGVIRPGRFTVFPQAIGLASMWDPELMEEISTAISDEARARWNELEQGKLQNAEYSDLLNFFSPTINMARDPRWGRTPETYGEDPYLTGTMGTAFVKGLQGYDPHYLKAAATLKHYAANNEEHNRMECKTVISEKQLREYYLPAYEMCVKDAHAEAVMGAYNAVNGVPCCCNKWLLTDLLRGEWGFDGYVVSDCGGIENIYRDHKYAASFEEAATLAIKAGMDLECGNYAYMEPLRNAYDNGMVSDEDIDRAAGSILKMRMRLGLFDSDTPYAHIDPQTVGCQKHQDLAMKAAHESIVLLKNENGFLPLDPAKVGTVAVVGNNAAQCEFGDYSGTSTVEPVSVLKALSERLGDKVKYVPWKTENDETDFIEDKYFTDGITVEYFEGQDFTNRKTIRKEPNVWYEPANKAPDPNVPVFKMSARWTGTLKPDVSGEYKLRVEAIGNSALWLDGKQLVSNGGKHEVRVKLEAGKEYAFKAEFTQEREVCPLLTVKWQKPENKEPDTSDSNVRRCFRKACEVAAESDMVVAVMGINRNYECEGRDRNYLTLPPEQIEFLQNIYAANANVVLVLVAGSSLAINWEDENLPAIVEAWYGGEFGGAAIADVLLGDYNPAGRLPLTFYKSMEQLPAFDDYDITKGRTYKYFEGEPLYEFGYGLSYTSFEYSKLKLKMGKDALRVKFNVKNTGEREGDEVAQVYVKLGEYEAAVSPIKELKGFKRVGLKPGEKKTVTVDIPREQLRYWSEKDSCFKTADTVPEVFVGASSADIRLRQ